MSDLNFQPVQGGLYQAAESVSQPAVLVYWLLLDGSPPAGDLTATATFSFSGCYIFIPSATPITSSNASKFITNMQTACAPVQSNARWVSWVSDPTNVPNTILKVNANLSTGKSTGFTVQSLSLPLANISLFVPSSSVFGLDTTTSPDVPALTFATNSTSTGKGKITLKRNSTSSNAPPLNLSVPLAGALAGTACFGAQWDRGDFYKFFVDNTNARDNTAVNTNEIRYFFSSPGGAPADTQTIHYPFFKPETQSQNPLALNVCLDPLNVWDYTRTRFALDVNSMPPAKVPVSNYFNGTDGKLLNLVPQQGAGFAFGKRPPAGNEAQASAYAYLTPVGLFDIASASGASNDLATTQDPTAIKHLMCGLTGTEYLIAAPGATVEFVPGNKAHTTNFTAPSSGNNLTDNNSCVPNSDPCKPGDGGHVVEPGELLSETYTTSWIRINPPAQTLADALPDEINYGYAVQSQASVYYSTVNKPKSSNDATPYTYPLALGCRVSRLEGEKQAAPVLLPMAPYGGIWECSTDPTTLPDAATFKSFESQIISSTRHATAPKDKTFGPTFFDPVTHNGIQGGYTKTPEGLLAQLNKDSNPGTFQTLFLAQSPVTPTQQLTFSAGISGTSPAVVSPDLSNALMNDNLFMVVTNPQNLGAFQNEIQLGEWTFRLDVGDPSDDKTILIFKFTTALSVVDLAANLAYWQEWQTFIADDEATVINVQKQLNKYLCMGSPSQPNHTYFEDFWNKVSCPDWTGILAINCGLDAAVLPIDLQDLLGGIDGELRPHHFGITVNQITGEDSSSWNIDQSSMFALIHYEKDYAAPVAPVAPFGFQVLRLNVLFENSVQTHFDSRIAATIPELFGEKVTLKTTSVQGANVLEIDGVYQKHGNTGTVVFDTKTPQIFSFTETTQKVRVIQEMYVTDAALVPISSTKNGATTTVLSNLALSGMLMFIPDVDPKKSGLDIFSYGDPEKLTGLGFNTYNIGMTTEITNNIGALKDIEPSLSNFMVTPATSVERPESLLDALPLKLTDFVFNPSSAGWAVKFLGQSSADFAADFALSFQVSLGSLGALSVVADSLNVDLVMGWSIAGSDGADNQIWLLMVPPLNMQGHLGFGLEGVLDTTFSQVELFSAQWTPDGSTTPSNVYGINFNNVQVEILGLSPIPSGKAKFVLFSNPLEGNLSNMGWLMTYKK
jgi:hypothetical protein